MMASIPARQYWTSAEWGKVSKWATKDELRQVQSWMPPKTAKKLKAALSTRAKQKQKSKRPRSSKESTSRAGKKIKTEKKIKEKIKTEKKIKAGGKKKIKTRAKQSKRPRASKELPNRTANKIKMEEKEIKAEENKADEKNRELQNRIKVHKKQAKEYQAQIKRLSEEIDEMRATSKRWQARFASEAERSNLFIEQLHQATTQKEWYRAMTCRLYMSIFNHTDREWATQLFVCEIDHLRSDTCEDRTLVPSCIDAFFNGTDPHFRKTLATAYCYWNPQDKAWYLGGGNFLIPHWIKMLLDEEDSSDEFTQEKVQ